MSQHQQAFLADDSSDIARVARRVLSMLAVGDTQKLKGEMQEPSSCAGPSFQELAERLYGAALCADPGFFAKALADVQRAGYSNDVLAFELIPAIARQLGASWVEDLISFTDVTIGCARLQSALHRLPDDIGAVPSTYNGIRKECLVIVPAGAQHTLGALVLAKQLRQARQSVVVELEAQALTLERLAQDQGFDVVLISASCGECPDALRVLVDQCRQRWTSCRIVLGGSVGELEQDVVRAIGADHVTSVWQEALDLCI